MKKLVMQGEKFFMMLKAASKAICCSWWVSGKGVGCLAVRFRVAKARAHINQGTY
jgi:hypothetical protein